jgi:hypothetical protein
LKKYLYALLILVIILPGCQSGKPTVSNDPVMSQNPVSTVTTEPSISTPIPTPVPTAMPTPTPAIIAKEIPAAYKEVEAARVIVKSGLPKKYKELAAYTVGKNKGEIVFYKETEDMIRYAYKTDKDFYPIGDIGAEHYLEDDTVGEAKIFGKSLVRVTGVCGANCPLNDYLQIENGRVSSFLFLGRHAQEIDVDQDGDKEIFSTIGTPYVEITIYKLIDHKLMEVNVNETLKAEKGVLYDDKKQLFMFGVGDHMVSYRLDPSGIFILEPTP